MEIELAEAEPITNGDPPIAPFYENDGYRVLFITIGAIVGALLRWKITITFASLNISYTKWSTLGINSAGSLVLGVIAALGPNLSSPYILTIGVGFCGSFTTFSTFAVDVVRLFDQQASATAMALLVLTNTIAIALAAVGYFSAKRLYE